MARRIFLLVFLAASAILFAGAGNIFVDSSLRDLHVKNRTTADSYHLFSHGRPGELYINNEWLSVTEIAKHLAGDLHGKKELYIYGCNFAAGEKGRAAVQYLEKALRVSVSASNNITGNDGDWILEVGNGKKALKNIQYNGNLQLDNTHYLNPVVYSLYDLTTIQEEYIYLSTPSASAITVQMNYAGGTGAPRVAVVNLKTGTTSYVANGALTFDNANPVRLQFVTGQNAAIAPGNTPTTLPYSQAGTITSAANSGLVFTSADKFYVNYRARTTAQAGSVMTKGKAALGREFRWGGSPIENTTKVPATGNMLSVMATIDNTTVVISNIKPGTKFRDGAAGTTTLNGPSITRTLNKGQSFILYAPVTINTRTVQDDGWLGAKVTSDKDVSVIAGGLMQQGGATDGDGRDIGLDQLVPKNKLGLEHVVMRGNGRGNAEEKVIIVATEDNTDIFLNDATTRYANLANAGDYILIPASFFNASENMRVEATRPAYVFHKIYGADKPNTNSIMFIPPLDCFGQKTVDLIPDARKIGGTAYTGTQLVVLAAAGSSNIPTVTLGGATLAGVSGTVTGNSNWVSYRYNITTDGNIKVTSNSAIQAQVFGADGDAGFGGYYSGFGNVPTLTVTKDTPYEAPCIGLTTLTANVSGATGVTYQWYRNGAAITGATSASYKLTDTAAATYYVRVSFPGGCSIRSSDMTSELCPCSKPGAAGTPDSYTRLGISTRAVRTTPNWPLDVPNGALAIESNNKGFVITRMPSANITAIPNPKAGMLVFDTQLDCLKLYNGTEWKCIKQTCNN